jgi:hypothetical protein
MGSLSGGKASALLDFMYASDISYTTLGVGDLFPTGPFRVAAGVEALNGLT